jgi:hypothetical protein
MYALPAWARRRARTVAATAAGALLAALVAAPGTAVAAPSATDCPTAFPVSEVTENLTGSGVTVEKGTTPDPFTVRFIGVLDDGIAPGIPMIIGEADSPAIRRAGGIWAGMSGSPVYAEDGRLIGSVSYGLAFGASPIAGITPAGDLLALAGGQTAPATAKVKVKLPKALSRKVDAASKQVSATEADAGMRQLQLPLAVSGLTPTRFAKLSPLMRKANAGVTPFRAGAAAATPAAPGSIFAGSNFAAALSYGDVSQVGVGTTTLVCDNVAVAFGHPMVLGGPSSLSAHSATALYVQPDSLGVPFKVANPGGVVGTVDQDRLTGIRGPLGAGPVAVPVTANATANSAVSRTGTTNINDQIYVPTLGATHLLADLDRVFQRIGEGRSAITYTINGTASDGTPFSMRRTNRFASLDDASVESVFELNEQLAAITGNEFDESKVTGVTIDAAIADQYRSYKLTKLEQQTSATTWAVVDPAHPVRATAGRNVVVRATLSPYKNRGGIIQKVFTLAVPASARGTSGSLEVGAAGAIGGGNDEECLIDPEACPPADAPVTSFPQLLASLSNAPHNNDVTAVLSLNTPAPTSVKANYSAPQVATGSLSAPVRVS